MELKRAIKKIPSEQNLKLLSSLIISLANKVDSTSEKCINPFTPNTAYAKGSYVTHDNYIYESKLACNDADWVESHWVRLSDTIDEIDVDTLKGYLGLTSEQIETLSKIILDSEIRLDKTWSSSRVYSSIQDAIDTSKAFTLAELGKASGASYRVVSSTGEMTDQKYIYLMSDGSGSYNMYIVEDDGTATQIGNTTLKLSDYYTKTEIDSDFLKKTDADGKYATITTVDGHKNDTVAHLTQEERDKMLTTDDIATSISNAPSDEKVVSEKAVDSAIKNVVFSNPNLLDNPWFTVNQRGKSSYTQTSSFYGVDRWMVRSDATLNTIETVNSDGTITITNDSGNSYILQYLREYKAEYFIGKEVTFSVMKGDGTIISHTFIYTSATSGLIDWNTGDSEVTKLRWQYQNNGCFTPVIFYNSGATIKAVKLEIGKESTLHLDIQPNYATELIKCQRHFIKYYNFLLTTTANDKDSTLLFAPITFPTNIRLSGGTTKISNYNISYVQLNGVRIDKSTITEINIFGVNNNVGYIQIRLSSNITTFPTTGLIYFTNLELSSEA